MKFSIASALAVMTMGSAAIAQPIQPLEDGASRAQLLEPVKTLTETLIDGRVWRCAGSTCFAGQQDVANSQPLWLECGDAAEKLGAFADYQTGKDVLNVPKLKACNSHAKSDSAVSASSR